MKWSNDDQEFVAPIISTTITHTRKHIANSYDTYQLIHNKNSTFSEEIDSRESVSLEKDIPQQGGDGGFIKVDKDFWGQEQINTEDWYEI